MQLARVPTARRHSDTWQRHQITVSSARQPAAPMHSDDVCGSPAQRHRLSCVGSCRSCPPCGRQNTGLPDRCNKRAAASSAVVDLPTVASTTKMIASAVTASPRDACSATSASGHVASGLPPGQCLHHERVPKPKARHKDTDRGNPPERPAPPLAEARIRFTNVDLPKFGGVPRTAPRWRPQCFLDSLGEVSARVPSRFVGQCPRRIADHAGPLFDEPQSGGPNYLSLGHILVSKTKIAAARTDDTALVASR